MKNTMNTTKKEVKVGLIGVGLNTYWNQFEGLLSRLTDYQRMIKERMSGLQATVIDGGIVDSPEKATRTAEVLKSDKTVLVDFWAVWCGPCRMLSPVVDQVAEENPNIKVCKVNVDEEQQLAIKYGVMSIPTLLVFKGGELVNQSVGVIPKEEVLNLIK